MSCWPRCRRCPSADARRRAGLERRAAGAAVADRLFVIGRGTGLAVAMEAALKLKETCGIQAEAFSGAEVKHGPMALVRDGYPLLVFAPRGPAQAGLLALAEEMRGRGGPRAAGRAGRHARRRAAAGHHRQRGPRPDRAGAELLPMVEALARARGFNPTCRPTWPGHENALSWSRHECF
jgi:glucosamine--fructose-6-phosphate aminotransferase (isomerizing)